MLQNLMNSLPEARRPALTLELNLLDRTLDALPMQPEDRALAKEADLQGLGAPLRDPRLQPEEVELATRQVR
jgi:hypothetical protein